MKFYDVDSMFTFGKYEGMTIAEVYEKDPKYIKYCQDNIDEFYVSPSVLKELKSMGRSASDAALLQTDFDKMDDDEIEDFMDSMDEDEDFDESNLEEDFDWENEKLSEDPFAENFDDEFDEEDDFDDDFGNGFGGDTFDGNIDDLY
jgi:hypothetical protein